MGKSKTGLDEYFKLPSPNKKIFKNTLFISILLLMIGVFFFRIIPLYPDFFYQIFGIFFNDSKEYTSWVNKNLVVSTNTLSNRLVFLSYMAMYLSMWKVYFKSKKSEDPLVEAKRYKVRTLRRLLGITSLQWTSDINNYKEKTIENYKKKAESSMIVIALFIAVSILIFEQISNVFLSMSEIDAWGKSKLWIAMLCVTIAFVCLMLCVDSLDTLYNNFKNDKTRNLLITYFQNFTLNPRYIATATMFLGMILWISFHSELLASLTIGLLFFVGYPFWFPKITENGERVPYGGLSLFTIAVLLIMPLLIHLITLINA